MTRNAPIIFSYVAVTSVGAATTLLACWLILRVRAGQLFLLSLGFEQDASNSELTDAQNTAEFYLPWAIVFLALLTLVVAFAVSRSSGTMFSDVSERLRKLFREHSILVTLLIFATLLDLVTTIIIAHRAGMEGEFHPGIRLVAYAFGRTIGVVGGKLFQCLAILVLSAYVSRFGPWLLLLASLAYLLGATINIAGAIRLASAIL